MLKKLLIFIIPLAIGGGCFFYFFANNRAEIEVDNVIAQLLDSGVYQALTYDEVEVGINGSATLTNLHVVDAEHNEYTISELKLSDYDYLHDIPHHMTISGKGLSFPAGLPTFINAEGDNPELEQFLNKIIVDGSIPVAVDYHYDYQPDANNLITSNVTMGLEQTATFSFSSQVKNIPLETLYNNASLSPEEAQQQFMASLAVAEIPQAKLQLEDLGILDMFLQTRADNQGINVEELRQQLSTQVEGLILFAPESIQAQATQVSKQLVSFLEGEKTFNISINPEFEGSVEQLQPQIIAAVFTGDYGRVLDLLGLKINTED